MKKYRIFCTTDSKYEESIGDVEPTQCPTDGAHAVDLNSIAIVDMDYKRIPNVSPRQIRAALLLSMGLTDADIEASINTLPSPDKELALNEYRYSTTFERDRALVEQMGVMLGKTSEELDTLWIYAGTL